MTYLCFIRVFLGFYLVLLFLMYSSVYKFSLTFSFCFYELGKAGTSSSLEGVSLCGSIPCVDYLHLEALAGQTELKQLWAKGSLMACHTKATLAG